MSYLLGIVVFLWCLFIYINSRTSKNQADPLGEFVLLVLAVLAALLSVGYVFAVLWFHRFV